LRRHHQEWQVVRPDRYTGTATRFGGRRLWMFDLPDKPHGIHWSRYICLAERALSTNAMSET
jgi:hypothetical protein